MASKTDNHNTLQAQCWELAEAQGDTRAHWRGISVSFVEGILSELSFKELFGESQVRTRHDGCRQKAWPGQALGGRKQHDVRGTPSS